MPCAAGSRVGDARYRLVRIDHPLSEPTLAGLRPKEVSKTYDQRTHAFRDSILHPLLKLNANGAFKCGCMLGRVFAKYRKCIAPTVVDGAGSMMLAPLAFAAAMVFSIIGTTWVAQFYTPQGSPHERLHPLPLPRQ